MGLANADTLPVFPQERVGRHYAKSKGFSRDRENCPVCPRVLVTALKIPFAAQSVLTPVAVEKVRDCGLFSVWRGVAEFSFCFLVADRQWCGWLDEEAHQALDILRSRCEEELLANELHPS